MKVIIFRNILGFLSTSFEYYGICKSGCGGFINSCLIPTGKGQTLILLQKVICYQTFSVLGQQVFNQFPCLVTSYTLPANYVFGAQWCWS